MPSRDAVHRMLGWSGFQLLHKNEPANCYLESGDNREWRLSASYRYQHKEHARFSPSDPNGSIYVHEVVGDKDAVLICNGAYRDKILIPEAAVARHSGTATNRDEPAWRGDALWRALIVLARTIK